MAVEVVAGVAAAGGLGDQLGGQRRQDAGLIFGLGGKQAGAAVGLEVEHGPQFGEDVQAVQAQVVGLPAGGEGGGEVAVAGPVDLVDPAAQPGDRVGAAGGREFPPGRSRIGAVAAGGVDVICEVGGQAGEVPVQDVEPGAELGDLLTVGGELVQDC
ncbi:MAG: hypothetical protein ACRDPY_00710 [Streptosporangiaceae bacterium]